MELINILRWSFPWRSFDQLQSPAGPHFIPEMIRHYRIVKSTGIKINIVIPVGGIGIFLNGLAGQPELCLPSDMKIGLETAGRNTIDNEFGDTVFTADCKHAPGFAIDMDGSPDRSHFPAVPAEEETRRTVLRLKAENQ